MRMKVDFNQDEFGEIWLTHVENLQVRKSRPVPTEQKTQIADFVLGVMADREKLEE